MDLEAYFADTRGVGVLSTADEKGRVDSAIYARPHTFDDGTIAFIMRDRLTHSNLQANPHAAYLFMESGGGYKGKRLFLTRIREEEDSELLHRLRRRKDTAAGGADAESKFLVFFRVDQVLPLVGPGTDEKEGTRQ